MSNTLWDAHLYVHKSVIFFLQHFAFCSSPHLLQGDSVKNNRKASKQANKQNPKPNQFFLLVITGLHHVLLPSNTEVPRLCSTQTQLLQHSIRQLSTQATSSVKPAVHQQLHTKLTDFPGAKSLT